MRATWQLAWDRGSQWLVYQPGNVAGRPEPSSMRVGTATKMRYFSDTVPRQHANIEWV